MQAQSTKQLFLTTALIAATVLTVPGAKAGDSIKKMGLNPFHLRLPLPPLPRLPLLPPVIVTPARGCDQHRDCDGRCDRTDKGDDKKHWRRPGRGHDHRRPQPPRVIIRKPVPIRRRPPLSRCESLEDQAWHAWRHGKYTDAYRYFGRLLRHKPHDGWTQVAYAIAAQHCGRSDQVLTAMRKAVIIDLKSLRRGPKTARMKDRLRWLRSRYLPGYRNLLHRRQGRPDGADFILALTSFMLGDTYLADGFIHRATAQGDRHRSTRVLALEIQRQNR